MEFGAVLKELTYKSVCLFFIFSYSFFAVACVAQHEEDKAIAVSEMCIFKKVLYNIPIDSIDRQIYKASSLLSGEILPQRKLSRTVTLRNISSEVGLIKYIFDVASFEEDLTNRV